MPRNAEVDDEFDTDYEVEIPTGDRKVIVEGKTNVPFKTFVGLVLQRKVTGLFQDHGNKSVIIDSEVLTKLASAPQDNQDNHAHVVLVTLVVGMLIGVFALSLVQGILIFFKQPITQTGFLALAGGLFVLAALVQLATMAKRRNRADKILEVMERVAWTLKR
ncbi:MAG TPA: hypothetical protein VI913_02300 [Candidatus Peribacteraceae bacterium]|nr:hypothetical protein [Candidatus Peribacteraceae bacterium]